MVLAPAREHVLRDIEQVKNARDHKINQIIGADLNDPDTRLFMLMSYSFVDLLKLKPIEEVVPDFKKNRH